MQLKTCTLSLYRLTGISAGEMLDRMQTNAVNGAVGRKVADIRRARGWSQADLADRFGIEAGRSIDPTTITRLEQGRRPLPVHELIAMALVLGVDARDLLPVTSAEDDRVLTARVRLDAARDKLESAAREVAAAEDHLAAVTAGGSVTPSGALSAVKVPAAPDSRLQLRGDPVIVDGVPPHRVWSSDPAATVAERQGAGSRGER